MVLSDDLEVTPTPLFEYRGAGTGFKVVALPPHTSGLVRVKLAGEPLYEWSIVPRLAVDSSQVKLIWGNYLDGNLRIILGTEAPLENHLAVGLFFRGVRLGSIWNHREADRLRAASAKGAEQALLVARLMRIFKFPILSENYAGFSRPLALNNLPAFVTAWLEELPVRFDAVELKSPGLDEAAAYAFAELVRLDPLDLDDHHAAALVEAYGGSDPLADPETALFKTTVELAHLSPLLAADVAKKWLVNHAPYLRRGIAAHTVLAAIRERLLGGLSEAQLLDQVSKATQTDENFIHCHLQSRRLPNWKSNVRALQHLLPFRVLLTRAFLTNL